MHWPLIERLRKLAGYVGNIHGCEHVTTAAETTMREAADLLASGPPETGDRAQIAAIRQLLHSHGPSIRKLQRSPETARRLDCQLADAVAVLLDLLTAQAAKLEAAERALRGVQSTVRPNCWCDHSNDVRRYGHQPKCLAVRDALSSASARPEGTI